MIGGKYGTLLFTTSIPVPIPLATSPTSSQMDAPDTHNYDGYHVLRVNNAAGVALLQQKQTTATRWVSWPPTYDVPEGSTSKVVEDAADDQEVIHLDAIAPNVLDQEPSLQLDPAHFQHPVEFEVAASRDQLPAQNLVVFLHGRGDSHQPFARLGSQMELPQTAVIALRAPLELPLEMGRTWYSDLDDDFNVIPPHTPHSPRSQSLQSARDFVWSFLSTLRDHYHWPLDRVFLFGFSQGASVAFHMAMTARCRLGGVVLVAGGAVRGPHNDPSTEPMRARRVVYETPALLVCGGRDDVFPMAMANETQRKYTVAFTKELFTRHVVAHKSHDMIRTRDEMRAVMEFFARHLFLRNVALENRSDLIEISSRR